MNQNPLSPLQEKMENAAPQKDEEVMALIQRKAQPQRPEQTPEVTKAKNDLRRIIKQVGIDPQRIIIAGQYAERALREPAMYPVAIQMAIKENLISENDIEPGGINYKLLAAGITAGKLTQELLDEGAL
jgi:anti-sigma-K factor RskA